MNINIKYRLEEHHMRRTLNGIRCYGYDGAMNMAFDRALKVLEREPESILCVTLLAWGHNLLIDAREAENNYQAQELKLLAKFYRRLAHKVYWEQHKNGEIGDLKDFIRAV